MRKVAMMGALRQGAKSRLCDWGLDDDCAAECMAEAVIKRKNEEAEQVTFESHMEEMISLMKSTMRCCAYAVTSQAHAGVRSQTCRKA